MSYIMQRRRQIRSVVQAERGCLPHRGGPVDPARHLPEFLPHQREVLPLRSTEM